MQKEAIEVLARDLMREHGLFEQGWTFGFDRAVRRAGCCHWSERRITISPKVTAEWTEAGVRDMVLHEIAHAICGHAAGHGFKWQRMHKSLGGNGKRLYSGYASDTSTTGVTALKHKWVGTCPACGNTHLTHKRLTKSCGECDPKYNERYRIVYTPNV